MFQPVEDQTGMSMTTSNVNKNMYFLILLYIGSKS